MLPQLVTIAKDKLIWVHYRHTVLKSLVIPLLEYCGQLCNPWKPKDIQAIEAIPRTFTYKITEVQYLNLERLHELKLYSLQRRSERKKSIYILKIAQQIVSKFWWHNMTQNRNQKTSNTWNTVCYSAPNKQKPCTIPSRKCNNCVSGTVVQLVAKFLRHIESVTTEKNSNLSSTNF